MQGSISLSSANDGDKESTVMKVEKPKPKSKEYIDATELSSLLKCVLDY